MAVLDKNSKGCSRNLTRIIYASNLDYLKEKIKKIGEDVYVKDIYVKIDKGDL